jgi:cytidine deaminase
VLVAAGGRRIVEALVVADERTGTPTPCGGCRQRLREFMALDAPVHLAGLSGPLRTVTLADLLPLSFGPEFLPSPEDAP